MGITTTYWLQELLVANGCVPCSGAWSSNPTLLAGAPRKCGTHPGKPRISSFALSMWYNHWNFTGAASGGFAESPLNDSHAWNPVQQITYDLRKAVACKRMVDSARQ